MELNVVNAACWVLRVLWRSSGQLGLLLGFFSVTLVRVLTSWAALPIPASRCLLGPALLTHRVPLGQGDGAATTWQAAPPPADWMRAHIGRGAEPFPHIWTAASGRTMLAVRSTASMAARRSPPTRALDVAVMLHILGDSGSDCLRASAGASSTTGGGGGRVEDARTGNEEEVEEATTCPGEER